MINAAKWFRTDTARKVKWALATVAAIVLAVFVSTAIAADSPLVGTWQSQPGQAGASLYIFTPKYYSMMRASSDRPDIADTNKATADELRATWGPFVANSGAYDVSGDLITIHPIVAKIPVVMQSGANEVYRFRIVGKTLTLTQVRNARGVAVEGAQPVTLTRVE